MPTSYNIRPVINTSYSITRLWGAYLMNNIGWYILTSLWQKIIVKVSWWTLRLNDYSTRATVNTSYSVRTPI